MVQFIHTKQNSILGNFAQGFSQGMQQGVQDYFTQKDNIQKNREKVTGFVSSYYNQFDKSKAYDDEHRKAAGKRALELTEQGVDFVTAGIQATQEQEQKSKEASQKQKEAEDKEKGFFGRAAEKAKKDLFGKTEFNPFKAGAQAVKETAASARQGYEEVKASRAGQKEDKALAKKPITEFTVDELFRMPKERFQNLKPWEQEIFDRKLEEAGEREALSAYAKERDPTGLFRVVERGFENRGLLPEQPLGPQGARTAAAGLGFTQRVLGSAKTAGKFPTAGKQAAVLGTLEAIQAASRAYGEEGRTASPQEIAGSAATGAALPYIGPAASAILSKVKAIPGAFKNLFKISKSTGASEKDIMEKAVESAAQKGVDVQAAAQGEPQALKAVEQEVNKTASVFNRAKKFNQAEGEQIRKEVGQKLQTSPLESHYKVTDKEPKTAAGQLSKIERQKPLLAEKKQIERSLLNSQYGILKNQEDFRNLPRGNAEVVQRFEAKMLADRNKHERLLAKLKDVEFELKHGKPPTSKEDLMKQISAQHKEFREGIHGPDSKKIAKAKKDMEADLKAIRQAEILAERGQLPGDVFDEYIRIHQEYGKHYDALIKELRDFAKANNSIYSKKSQVARATELADLVSHMKKTNAAKITNQLDKRKALKILNKPSGAFYKNALKDIHKDVAQFRNQFFKAQPIFMSKATSTHLKGINIPKASQGKPIKATGQYAKESGKQATGKAAQEAPKTGSEAPKSTATETGEKVAKETAEAVKNPTTENIEKVAKDLNVDPAKFKKFFDETTKELKDIAKKIEAGKATEKDIATITKSFNRFLTRQKHVASTKRYGKAGLQGAGLGLVQGLIEQIFDVKLNQGEVGGIAGLITPGGFKYKVGSGLVASRVYKWTRDFFENKEAKKLKKLRNTPEFSRYYKSIQDRYSSAAAKRIHKLATNTDIDEREEPESSTE